MSSFVVSADHLTTIDREAERRQQRTYAGQASWADPDSGKTCRQCSHWTGCGQGTGYVAKWRTLKPRPCAKYRALMNGKVGAAVPHDAFSCRFFEADPQPPAINGK
jgi:hypothetical protein